MPTRQERRAPWCRLVKRLATGAVCCFLGGGILLTLAINTQPHGGYYKSKADIAGLAAKKFATEAYELWRQAHPGEVCPETLDELNEWADSKDGRDPWGQQYRMYCDRSGVFGVWSNGEDRLFNTPDDIHSWDQ